MPIDKKALAVLDEYMHVTDTDDLKKYSAMALRKCVRLHTGRMSIADFTDYATKKGWQLTPVPWCNEAFFVEREDTSIALGKDLLHQLGVLYIQEASSMLPATLLDPKPGEMVLDMSAAPGSKTTQMSNAMQCTGMIIANDIQPIRLKTLQAACHRTGASNVLLTQKKGQWFGYTMVEQFDRVLCDAPCSAQGTIRKDTTALDFFEQTSVKKMAAVQLELLEAAIAATKVDGRIVYSTCTLTFAENEALVHAMLQKFPNALTVVSPAELGLTWSADAAIDAASKVQAVLELPVQPMFRLWPQTYNTEGFFCVALQKTASTHPIAPYKPVLRREQRMSPRTVRECTASVLKQFGTNFLKDHETLMLKDGDLFLVPTVLAEYSLPLRDYSLGIPYGKLLKDSTIRISNELSIDRGAMATGNVVQVHKAQLQDLLSGHNSNCDATLTGDVLIAYEGQYIGLCLAQKGVLKNRLSRELIMAS